MMRREDSNKLYRSKKTKQDESLLIIISESTPETRCFMKALMGSLKHLKFSPRKNAYSALLDTTEKYVTVTNGSQQKRGEFNEIS